VITSRGRFGSCRSRCRGLWDQPRLSFQKGEEWLEGLALRRRGPSGGEAGRHPGTDGLSTAPALASQTGALQGQGARLVCLGMCPRAKPQPACSSASNRGQSSTDSIHLEETIDSPPLPATRGQCGRISPLPSHHRSRTQPGVSSSLQVHWSTSTLVAFSTGRPVCLQPCPPIPPLPCPRVEVRWLCLLWCRGVTWR
jgi:hypothetical protein